MTAPDLSLNVQTLSASVLDSNFAQIDWRAPWLCHLNQRDYLSKIVKQFSAGDERHGQVANADIDDTFANDDNQIDIIAKVLNQALKKQSEDAQTSLPTTKPTDDNKTHDLKFVSQDALPEGVGYEQFIGATGNIPTRDNLHDLFNGSIWLTFPKTKALLNHYHMLEIAKHDDEQDGGKSRGRVRDTITVFDENGAILVTADPSIGQALIDFDWQGSLVTTRDSWDDPKLGYEERLHKEVKAAVYIFGHALLEQLISPRKPLCAHSVVISVSQDFFALSLPERIAFLDDQLAEYMDRLLSQDKVTPRQLSPLPILGVPHFWSENDNANFYNDPFVFRSGRQRNKA